MIQSGDFIKAYNKVTDRNSKRTESLWADRNLSGKKAPLTFGVMFIMKDRERAKRDWQPAVRYQRNVKA